MTRVPFMLLGDGPQESSGLGRIARDLGSLLAHSDLPIDFVQVGGNVPPVWPHWRHYPLDRSDDWGAKCTVGLWESIFGKTPGILMIAWDPGRCAAYRNIPLPVQKWAYTAIDAPNTLGTLGGPGGAAIQEFDQVLAYGRWASTIVRTLRPTAAYLPHGLNLATYAAPATPEELAWAREQLGPYYSENQILVGCVATNQPRKDLGLYCHALSTLRANGHKVFGWLHTDTLIKDWAIPQLAEDFNLYKHLTVTLDGFTDRQMAVLYQLCGLTIAPGLGEGFGYPIVESLAAGTPVVHGDFGGGRELVPRREWRFPVRALRLESVYALQRPVFQADDVANAALRVLEWRDEILPETAAAYCKGAVAHLDWSALWPRWNSWFRRGLHA